METRYTRQSGIVDTEKIQAMRVTVIGAGAVGSFAMLALTKLGVNDVAVYDEDGVADHNIPNQFYRVDDAKKEKFKVEALEEIVMDFNGVEIETNKEFYTNQHLGDVVIVATDSMSSRQMVWEQFLVQNCKVLIEARMGGELGIVYCIRKHPDGSINGETVKFYQETLHPDDEAEELPCTERTIIYNVLMIASLICRAFKAVVKGEDEYPREVVFDMRHMVFMDRK